MKNTLIKLIENKSSNIFPQTIKSSPGLLDWLKSETQEHNPKNTNHMVYIILNGNPPTCLCGNPRKFNTFDLGYRVCCDRGLKCLSSIDAKMAGLKKNLMENYGVTNANDIPGVTEKRKATMLQNHGVEYAAQSNSVQEKMSKTMQARSTEEKESIVAKTKATMIHKFGVSHHMKLDEQKQKVKDTNVERYGVEYPLQDTNIKEAAIEKWKLKPKEEKQKKAENTKKTFQEKYGVNSYSQIGMQPWVLEILKDKDKFISFISDKTRLQAAESLGIHPHCLYLHYKEYQANTLFLPTTRSKFEINVGNFLDSMDIKYISGDRQILKPRELDYYIPDKNIAIECGGLYWHSELSSERGRDYHYSKFQQCKDQGIKLITIFEDEWNHKNNQVLQRLTHIFGKSIVRISARECIVKIIDSKEASDFIEANHLQGSSSSSVNIGLYHNDILVSVMTFGKPRFSNDYDYELIRFCSNANVIGGASKLFKYFSKEYTPSKIISYSDNRWGWGELYNTLGFKYKNTHVGYHYTDYKHRYNRIQFQKHKLLEQGNDATLTEWEIMQVNGYDRIWDCGQSSWVWINKRI